MSEITPKDLPEIVGEGLRKGLDTWIGFFFYLVGILVDILDLIFSPFISFFLYALEPVIPIFILAIFVSFIMFLFLFVEIALRLLYAIIFYRIKNDSKKGRNLVDYFSCISCEFLEITLISRSPSHEYQSYCMLLEKPIIKLEACSEHLPYTPKTED